MEPLLPVSMFTQTTTAAAVLDAVTPATLDNFARQVPERRVQMLPSGVFYGSLPLSFLSQLRIWTMKLRMRSRPGLRGRPLLTGPLMWRRKSFPLLHLSLLWTLVVEGSLGPLPPPTKPRRPRTLRPPLGRPPQLWISPLLPLPPSSSTATLGFVCSCGFFAAGTRPVNLYFG